MLPVDLTLGERAWLAGALRFLATLPDVDAYDRDRVDTITAKLLPSLATPARGVH